MRCHYNQNNNCCQQCATECQTQSEQSCCLYHQHYECPKTCQKPRPCPRPCPPEPCCPTSQSCPCKPPCPPPCPPTPPCCPTPRPPRPPFNPPLPGGYSPFRPLTAAELTIFQSATSQLVGVTYEPLFVSTQIVNGTNYIFIAHATVTNGTTTSNYYVSIQVYVSPTGAITLGRITPLNS